MDTLRNWAEENNVEMEFIGHGGRHGGFGSPGGLRGDKSSTDTDATE